MTISKPRWPDYLPAPTDDVFALGVIALTYGQLENIFRLIFSGVTRMNEFQTAAFFQRIPNNIRLTILHELMAETTIPPELKDLVVHFSDGFKICAENRHAVMHSHSGGIFTSQSKGTRGIVLTKFTRGGKEQVCLATLEELRTVADDIHRYVMFGATFATDLRIFGERAERGEKSTFALLPLHDRPPPPTEMNWQSPEIALTPQPQPEAFRG